MKSLLPLYGVLHIMHNMAALDNNIVRRGLEELRTRLPPGWTVRQAPPTEATPDAAAEISAPGARPGLVAAATRTNLDPKDVGRVVDEARARNAQVPLIVIARYLSESTRTRLRERDVSYLDLTGNVRIVVSRPGLFIETLGASEDPDRKPRSIRSLRGAKAGRIVRALVDRKVPPGVRELAASASVDAGYVSRVLAFLDTEDLITRVGRGRIERVNWSGLLQRWAHDAPLESRGQSQAYLDPRGLPSVIANLRAINEPYAVTGSLALTRHTGSAITARLAIIWVNDSAQAAQKLALRSVEKGANVLLIEPYDNVVFENTVVHDNVQCASPSQTAADLLTSPGRSPAEADELISWMEANEEAWRR